MSADDAPPNDVYRRARSQFGRTAAAYVTSAGHAKGAELAEMVAYAETVFGPLEGRTALDVATGGGHTALAFARGVGEFGSIVLISGNIPFHTQVASVFVFKQIESDNSGGAAAVSVVLLLLSLLVLRSPTEQPEAAREADAQAAPQAA